MPLRQTLSAGMSSVTGPLQEKTWTGELCFYQTQSVKLFSVFSRAVSVNELIAIHKEAAINAPFLIVCCCFVPLTHPWSSRRSCFLLPTGSHGEE